MPHTLVIVPTYNERENLSGLLPRLRRAVPDAEVLVVDDGSPDGTGQVADAFALADAAVHVLHRPAKAGWPPPTSRASSGASDAGSTCWSAWTPTVPTSPSNCRCCWMPPAMPTS